ncbi:hypothetical protein BV25DRAFT_624838 [Artomyces pyxidatus]|uniref:Uncharacterized protein n=1 Tax=Artomyces pyxidatus TaxID=48021 RepID=A0ACB8SDK0_9AGAM|nr:hypothetical protein BV25DRAFT_624838 [Artomyces pyxidatus]
MGEELAAFFTSDAPENPCARCKKVVRNELLVYIKDRSGRKPGKNVCPACHDHIKSKGTTVQTGHQHEQQQVSQVQLPSDHQFIVSKQVAAAQRGEPSEVRAVGSIRPRRLSQERMPPPPLPAHSNHRPHVEVPGLPGRSSSDNAAIVTPRISISDGLGYQDAHKRYEETRLALRNRARNGSAHTVTVIARMATLTAGRLTPKLVENIMESIPDIPVRIGAIELKKIVFNALYPMFIQWSRGFHVPMPSLSTSSKTAEQRMGEAPRELSNTRMGQQSFTFIFQPTSTTISSSVAQTVTQDSVFVRLEGYFPFPGEIKNADQTS